jgi:hypothetical protein
VLGTDKKSTTPEEKIGELIDNQGIKLKQEMSQLLLTGGEIEHRNEERFVMRLFDLMTKHPELKVKYLTILQEDIPESQCFTKPNIYLQTSRAFLHAQMYLQYLWKSGVSSENFKLDTISVENAKSVYSKGGKEHIRPLVYSSTLIELKTLALCLLKAVGIPQSFFKLSYDLS